MPPAMHFASELEQAVVDEINLARARPREYAGYVHASLSRSRGLEGGGFEELFNVLRVRSPVIGLRVSRGLCAAAKKRVETMASGGQVRDNHTDLANKVIQYGKPDDITAVKEVLWAGKLGYDVRKVVLSMLADDNNPTRSRRTSLLSSSATVCGVAYSSNIVSIVLATGFVEGSSNGNMPTPRHVDYCPGYSSYSGFPHGKPDEPVQQQPPARQVMTPSFPNQQHKLSNKTSPTLNNNAGTPKLSEYDDIRKIINNMPNPNQAYNGVDRSMASKRREHSGTAHSNAHFNVNTPTKVSNVHTANYPANTPGSTSRHTPRTAAMNTHAATANTNTPTTFTPYMSYETLPVLSSPVSPDAASPLQRSAVRPERTFANAKDHPVPRADAVKPAAAKGDDKPPGPGYSGVIVGLEGLLTTLAKGNGESNYVGFNSSLQDRISGWLRGVQVPAV
eukprot:TRINITY_DN10350_c0_g3_i1.p1 TRINITY_DN10350_c0_g3~~TRINITY_DN10350_c0_g3_i1.p1  ORF type:complete len:449 (+),score=149.01 TRINITY_DN10350_c0_g3_i1:59-1405(+)